MEAILLTIVLAPLVGALIFISQAQDPQLGGLALFSLGLFLGLPLLLHWSQAAKAAAQRIGMPVPPA